MGYSEREKRQTQTEGAEKSRSATPQGLGWMKKKVKPGGAYRLRQKGRGYMSDYTFSYQLRSNLPLFLNCMPELVIFEMEKFRVLKRIFV